MMKRKQNKTKQKTVNYRERLHNPVSQLFVSNEQICLSDKQQILIYFHINLLCIYIIYYEIM